MSLRNGIQDFELANPIYKGATVTFYTVSGGVKTVTKATLYADPTTLATLPNPQHLGADGKFVQPVYVEVEVIASISGLTIPDHDTSVIQSVLGSGSIDLSATIHAATNKATPVGADEFGYWDSVTGLLKKLTWTNFLAIFSAAGGATLVGTAVGNVQTDINARPTSATLAASSGSSLVGFLQAGVGAIITSIQERMRQVRYATDFDTLAHFFAGASGCDNFIPAGSYTLTNLLDLSAVPLSNCVIRGVPGGTVITGAFGYGLLKLGDLDNVIFDGITFNNTYSNAAQSALNAVVSSHYSTLTDVTFRNCTFNNASCNCDALGVYLYDDTHLTGTQYVNGLCIEDCTFTNVGRIGCTLMNRKYFSADPLAKDLFRNVQFNRNTGTNLGLQNSYGFLLSLDANGRDAQVDSNKVYNALGIGIENTSWDNVTISNNTFDGFSRAYAPIACGSNSVYTSVGALTLKCIIKGNRTASPSSLQSYLKTLGNSIIEDNFIENNASYTTIEVIDSSNNFFRNNIWKNTKATGQMALIFVTSSGTVSGNRTEGETYDTSSSTTNLAPLYFRGATCTKNIASNPVILKGTGGAYAAEDTSAINNQIVRGTSSLATPFDMEYIAVSFITDADKTLSITQYCEDYIQINTGALTIARNVILPTLVKRYTFLNNTTQALTFKAPTGTGITIATTKTATLFFDGTNVRRLTADF